MNLKSLLAATALCSVMIAPAYAQTAPKMRDVLKGWQLDKPSATIQFVTKSVTEDRAILENVVFKDKPNSETTFSQITINRMPATGSDPSLPLFNVIMQNGKLLEDDGTQTTIGQVDVAVRTRHANLSELNAWLVGGNKAQDAKLKSSPSMPSRDFSGDVRVAGLVSISKDKDGKPSTTKIGTTSLIGFELKPDYFAFSRAEMENLETQDSESTMTISRISLADIRTDTLVSSASGTGFDFEKFDLNKFSLGSMRFENIDAVLKMKDAETGSENLKFSLAQFEIANWKDGKIGKFGFSGMKAATGVAEKKLDMTWDSFALEGINVAYFQAVGEAAAKFAPKDKPKAVGRSALLGFADFAMAGTNLVGATNPLPLAPATPASSSPKLKDLLPGGPLDIGIGAISLTNFSLVFQGVDFTIDKVATSTVRNADGIITSTNLAPVSMKLTIPEALLNEPNSPMAMFAPLVSDGVELRISGASTYDPVSDVVKLDDLNYTFKGWAGINFDFAMDGMAKFYREQTIDALVAPFADEFNGVGEAESKEKRKPQDLEEIKRSLAIYQGIRLLGAALELRDHGGLAKAAGVFASMAAPRSKGATSRTAVQDAQAVAQVRQSWAEPLRQSAAEKSKSIMERQFLISLARWIEVGGVMTALMQPPAPIDFSTLADPKDLPTRLGITFTNQPAAKN